MASSHLGNIGRQGVKLVTILLALTTMAIVNPAPASAAEYPYSVFENANSWLCLDVVDWGSYEGANVQQWGCNNNWAQQWEVVFATRKWAQGPGPDDHGTWWYEIVNRANHRCLAVAGRSEADGANVIVEDCDAGPNQYWARGTPAVGVISLRALHSNKCLDVARLSRDYGANVQQWTCWSGPNQRWYEYKRQ
jgi:agarase